MRKPGLLSGEERIMAVGGSKGPSWLISSIVKAARSIFSNPETPLAKLCIMLCTLTIEIIGGIALCVIGAVIPRCKGRHNEGLMLPYACGRTHCCADPSCQTGCVQVPHVAILLITGPGIIAICLVLMIVAVVRYKRDVSRGPRVVVVTPLPSPLAAL